MGPERRCWSASSQLRLTPASRCASIAGGMLETVVARPVAVGVPEVEWRAGEDDLAAAGAPHLPAGDEGSESLLQRTVRAAVAACRRAAATTRALSLLNLTARA